MIGEGSPKGTYSKHGVGSGYGHMTPGKRYRVVKEFKDFDGGIHAVGEEWTYVGTAFLPYDDGRSIFVSVDGEREWHIRMQDREEEQRYILDNFHTYVAAV